MLIYLSYGLSLIAGDLVDRLAIPGRRFALGSVSSVLFRGAVLTWLWTVAMALSRRPLYAVVAATIAVAVVVVISNQKHKALREPLVFSDFAFIGAVMRNPRLFYLDIRSAVLLALLVAGACAATAIWWHHEPAILSLETEFAVAGAAVGLPLLALARWPGPDPARWAIAVLRAPARDAHLPRLGLLGSLLAYWLAWLHQTRNQHLRTAPGRVGSYCAYEAILVIQAESFVDLRRHGMPSVHLPAYDALRGRALASGLLDVPCFGAYTLRPEAAVLTGFGFAQAGFDAFNPYLRGERLAASAIPNRLPVGWRTHFIHPFLRSFFRRDRVVAAFGFDAFDDGTHFDARDHVGPYVGDMAVARRMLDVAAEARRNGTGLYLHAVTMEAHDPYGPGRITEAVTPTGQYVHHIGNADRMLGLIAAELDRDSDRVLLVHYGDHAPLLADRPGAFADSRTDFLVVELGRSARSSDRTLHLTQPEDLHTFILDQFRHGPDAP